MNQLTNTNVQMVEASDMFFLDIKEAYLEALKQNKIVADNGQERLQYCYYDGPLTDIVLENFMRIPVDNFVEVFSKTQLPIPVVIVSIQNDERLETAVPADILAEIARFRLELFGSLSNPNRLNIEAKQREFLNADTYFIEPLLALNVAKQRNKIFSAGSSSVQYCYYRGELPAHNFVNLLHVELTEFIEFFSSNDHRLPTQIEMPDELELDLQLTIKTDIEYMVSLVEKNREKF
jgi:CRISPR/Cas system-associated endoribonuclease Cas2